MPTRIIEVATGLVDGVNKTFSTSQAYKPGTVVAFIEGQARIPATELGGTSFILDNNPPLVGDTVSVYYMSLV